MTGCRCTVATCNNSLEKTKKEGRDISYHKFPKDATLRAIWIQKCRRDGKWNPDVCRVCSEHFAITDYEEDKYEKFLGTVPKRRKLKKTAVPSLQLPGVLPISPSSLARKKRLENRNNKAVVQDLLKISTHTRNKEGKKETTTERRKKKMTSTEKCG